MIAFIVGVLVGAACQLLLIGAMGRIKWDHPADRPLRKLSPHTDPDRPVTQPPKPRS